MLFGPKKYEHRQLIRDLRGADEDVRKFALRTVIQLEKANLKNEAAVGELTGAIEAGFEGWPEETRFYATRALEHLAELKKAFQVTGDAPEFDPATAEIDLDELGVDDPRVVLRCLRCIAAQGHTAARSEIVARLPGVEDPKVLVGYLEALGAVAAPETLFEIPRFNDHPNRRVRRTYVEALAAISDGDPSGDGLIAPFLQDADGAVRACAIGYLGRRDLEAVREAAERTLASNEPADRAALAQVLIGIESDETIPWIRALADDPDETVRLQLIQSIVRSDHAQKTFVVKKMSKDADKGVRKVALEAQSRMDAARLLSMGGFKGPPGKGATEQRVEDVIHGQDEIDPIVLEDLRAEEPEVKLRCLRKIRQRNYEEAYPQVVDLLGVTENVQVLASILRCLTVIGSTRDAESTIHFLTHPAARVRAAAAEALNQLGNPKQILYLLLPMLHDDDVEVQGAAAKAVLRFSPNDVQAALGGMAQSKTPAIRARLVHFLTHYQNQAVTILLTRLTQDPEPAVRMALLRRPLPLEAWADQLVHRLTADPVEEISTAARHAKVGRERMKQKGQHGGPLPRLEQLFDVARERQVTGAAAREEREAAEAQALAEAAEARALEAGSGPASAFDQESRKADLKMFQMNRDVLLEGLGKKVYGLLKKKEIQHADYDRPSFLVDKYVHLLKTDEGGGGGGGFWGAIKGLAGIEEEDPKRLRNQEKLRQAYVELGRTCFDLSIQKNVIHNQLAMEYNEVEQVMKKIEVLSG